MKIYTYLLNYVPGHVDFTINVCVAHLNDIKFDMILFDCSCTENENSFPDKHKELIKGSTNPGFGVSSVSSSISGSIRLNTSTTPTKPGTTQGRILDRHC